MKRFIVVFVALASLLLTSHRSSAAPLKACDFMNPQTASSVFGATVNAGREETVAEGAQQCVFDHDDPAASGQIAFGLTDVNAMAASMGVSSAAIIPIIKQSASGQKSETIPALGEWNCYSWNGLTDYTLAVLYHGKVLSLVSSGSKNPNLKAALTQAMRQVMQKF